MSLSDRTGNNNNNHNRRSVSTISTTSSSSSDSSSTDSENNIGKDNYTKFNHPHRRPNHRRNSNTNNNDSRSQNQKNKTTSRRTSTSNGKKSESGIISSGIDNPSYSTSYYDDEDDHGIGDCGDGGGGNSSSRSGWGGDHNRGSSGLPNGFITGGNNDDNEKPRTNNKNKGHPGGNKTRKGKKFPPSPLPLPEYETPKRSYSSNVTSITPNGMLSSPSNDMDLVDYEDYGSTSSEERDCRDIVRSRYQNRNELDTNFKPQGYPRTSGNNSSNSNTSKNFLGTTDYSKFNGGGGGTHKEDQRRSSLYEKSTTLPRNPIGNHNDPNAPCSSTSVREGDNIDNCIKQSLISSTNSNTKTKFLKKSASKASAILDSDTTGNNGNSGRKDNYSFSGVGRHFGRIRRESAMNLTDDEFGSESAISGRGASSRLSIMGREISDAELYGWKTRLKAVSIVFLATIFILSTSSLLFVFPIIIDPILLGLEAQFSTNPVQCRTTKLRNGTGPSECAVPSCRAGCTADLFSCSFIDVEYSIDIPSMIVSTQDDLNKSRFTATTTPTSYNPLQSQYYEYQFYNETNSEMISFANSHNDSTGDVNLTQNNLRRATLFININGCGYPPEVNCSEFHKSYAKLDIVFPCYYSQNNESIVVPHYSFSQQKRYLIIALSVPFSLAIFSAIFLVLLMKCRPFAINRVMTKNSSSLKLIESAESNHDISKSNGIDKNTDFGDGGESGNQSNGNNKSNGISKASSLPQMNGTVPKANGHVLQDTMAGLLGMDSPQRISQSIKKLPHQHDSFDKSLPYLNGSVPNSKDSTSPKKQKRYAKNKKLTRGQSIESNHYKNHDRDEQTGSEEDQM